jgi:hypothetical protein
MTENGQSDETISANELHRGEYWQGILPRHWNWSMDKVQARVDFEVVAAVSVAARFHESAEKDGHDLWKGRTQILRL